MSAHADADVLAAFREGLLPRRRTARIERHLGECGRCAAINAGLADVTALLAAAPAPPLPASFAARLDAALAQEVTRRGQADVGEPAMPPDGRAAPGRHAGGRRGRPRLALTAAVATAAVAVLGGGGYAIVRLMPAGREPTASSAAAPSPAGAASGKVPASPGSTGNPAGVHRTGGSALGGFSGLLSYPVVASGTDYRAGHLAAQVAALLRQHTGVFRQAPASLGGAAERQPATAGDLAACVRRVTGGRRPDIVDVARYNGHPATVIVTRSGTAETVWVVGTGCSGSSGDVITRVSLPHGG